MTSSRSRSFRGWAKTRIHSAQVNAARHGLYLIGEHLPFGGLRDKGDAVTDLSASGAHRAKSNIPSRSPNRLIPFPTQSLVTSSSFRTRTGPARLRYLMLLACRDLMARQSVEYHRSCSAKKPPSSPSLF